MTLAASAWLSHFQDWTLSAVLVALASFGCSGDAKTNDRAVAAGGQGGASNDPKCDASFAPTDPTALVDDLEDGDGLVAQVAGRNGSWWIASDETGGTVTPPANQAPLPERILGGRCNSKQGIRVTGSGFSDWGAVLIAGMKYSSKAEPTDASAYKGLMFWARVGEANSSAIRVQFQDSQTQPEGGLCNPEPGSPDECYNGFGTRLVPIDTEWRLYRLPFASMTQRDFGYIGDSFDTANVFDIEWTFEPGSVFDLWVDDIWFYE